MREEIDWHEAGMLAGEAVPWHMRRPSTDRFNVAWDAFRLGFEVARGRIAIGAGRSFGLTSIEIEEMKVEFAIHWDRSQRP